MHARIKAGDRHPTFSIQRSGTCVIALIRPLENSAGDRVASAIGRRLSPRNGWPRADHRPRRQLERPMLAGHRLNP